MGCRVLIERSDHRTAPRSTANVALTMALSLGDHWLRRRAKANDILERSNVLRPLVISYDPFDALH